MRWNIVAVRPLGGRDIGVRFADGLEGTVTVSRAFCTGVFSALLDDDLLLQAQVVDGAVGWPNGLDLAPDTMYRQIEASPERRYTLGQPVRLAA